MSRSLASRALLIVILLTICGCQTVPPAPVDSGPLPLIPMPVAVERRSGHFEVAPGSALVVNGERAAGSARYFADLVERTRGLHFALRTEADASAGDAIVFQLQPATARTDGDESYRLSITPHRITLTAGTPHGLFNGAVSLWQLLVPGSPGAQALRVPCAQIEDYPRFAWRGLLLDSARHFQSPEFVKHFIDTMALHKLNVMHWHLTDDQGWRIQIKKYPKLTEIGAWRAPQPDEMQLVDPATGKYGGFYTQDQIRDIVRYAAERYVTIVPEIDMPGHAQAAIAAYPQVGVTGAQPAVSSDWGINTWLFDVSEYTFSFVESVLTEVMELFPSKYIHVGGDEAAKDQWQASARVQERMRRLGIRDEKDLQGYFTVRLEGFLRAHGRTLVGWDEILEGGLPPTAIVMSWRGTEGAVAAAQHGIDVVMSPDPAMYLDHLQSNSSDEPPGRVKVISLADVYAFEAVPHELDADQARHVLGGQANLWSEYLTTPERVEHAAFPRAAALAEVLWSPPEGRSWDDFLARLPSQFERYRALGVAFADTAFEPQIAASQTSGSKTGGSSRIRVGLSKQIAFGTIRYTLDDSVPGPQSREYREPLMASAGATVRAATFSADRQLAAPRAQRIDASAVARRYSDALKPCGDSLLLRLEGGSDGVAAAPLYNVNLMNPCWIYTQADLAASASLDVRVGALPYFFQLWHDADKVVTYAPSAGGDELQLRLDGCTGAPLATVPLGDSRAARTLSVPLERQSGLHDICLVFATRQRDPLWLIDWVEPRPRPARPD
ncbi:MAG TPA: family 20 glycosylhydrolase [Rudaea sp.]|nr:family 20 glycosylhydrolase [Rudaea sp.]